METPRAVLEAATAKFCSLKIGHDIVFKQYGKAKEATCTSSTTVQLPKKYSNQITITLSKATCEHVCEVVTC